MLSKEHVGKDGGGRCAAGERFEQDSVEPDLSDDSGGASVSNNMAQQEQ